MSNIVSVEYVKERVPYSVEWGYQDLAIKNTLFVHDDKVALSTSYLVGFKNNKQANPFVYWKTAKSFGFRKTTTGNVIPFYCSRPLHLRSNGWSHKNAEVSFTNLNVDASDIFEQYGYYVGKNLGVKSVLDVFPMMNKIGEMQYHSIPTGLHNPLRQDSEKDFAVALLGKTRATGDIVGACVKTSPIILSIAGQFRGLVPEPTLKKYILDNVDFDDSEYMGSTNFNIRNRLLLSEPGIVSSLLEDSVRLSSLMKITSLASTRPRPFQDNVKDTAPGLAKWDYMW